MAFNYGVLADEINADPLIRGYGGMSDQQIADDINTEYRSRNRASMTPTEVYNNVDESEFTALTQAQQDEVYKILHMGQPLNPFGLEADRFISIFGGGSNTIIALQALRVDSITRAAELGLGVVSVGHVEEAKAMAR